MSTTSSTPAAERLTTLIVDDHSIFRSGLRAELSADIDVLGEAGTVEEAVEAIRELRPVTVLLDVHLPGGRGGGGAEVIARTTGVERSAPGASPAPGASVAPGVTAAPGADPTTAGRPPVFLALSVSDAADDVVRVIRAGARGYLTKSTSGAEVSTALHRVVAGDAVFSPLLAGFVLDAFGAAGGEEAASDEELDRLTRREQEVMRLIAQGYAYKEVASELFISIKTVETHVSSVLRKLQLSSRHELTAWALSRRLL
ncbi:response regulator transcription factor [Brachybacterium sp. ACRRE]|uniref:LuxR C-terminal-related transcriptional regulator n=1 Tax=Brachybacterium sp. ACRRE TaxID=2918184 RepID=UPI001EF38A7A|nr:response regulator transcription factor [Brachybacterium sp. ACRRE]MCG7308589.1 response regulator transcription factor [Brachybacterium sp. ACRRE]